MSEPRTVVWFRRDLRLGDHPALSWAAARGAIVPLFIWAPEEEGHWPPGAASRWWLHRSLAALDASLRRLGTRLIFRRGPSAEAVSAVARESGADAVTWNGLPDPGAEPRDEGVAERLRAEGREVSVHRAGLLFEPAAIRSAVGTPFAVFSPFWRACLAAPEPAAPLPAPRRLSPPGRWPSSLALDQLDLDPRHPWGDKLARAWQPGEASGLERLRALPRKLGEYPIDRDRPDLDGTSSLSPHLHHGEISPHQVWQALRRRAFEPPRDEGAQAFLRELGWREFTHHVLAQFPALPDRPWRALPGSGWRSDRNGLRAWQRGRTGYPLVDAGMRQLWATGWMHNRVRMVTASFLLKHLLIPWQEGERWFWDTLVDADLANNAFNWQWVAGTGADAAPFFRIFNPVVQGQRFDPRGDYIRRWVPELAHLPAAEIHEPWKVGTAAYPAPIVEHRAARARALKAFGAGERHQEGATR